MSAEGDTRLTGEHEEGKKYKAKKKQVNKKKQKEKEKEKGGFENAC